MAAKKATSRKKSSAKKKSTRRTPARPKSLKGLKGGLRSYWAKKGVKP